MLYSKKKKEYRAMHHQRLLRITKELYVKFAHKILYVPF